MINVFIPHRWNNEDYAEISQLLDRTRFVVRDYSVPRVSAFDHIDRRYNVDPQIQKQIRYASVVICSNRPSNSNGMAIEEVKFALSIRKPVVAIAITINTCAEIDRLGIPIIAKRKDALENWIDRNVF